MCVCVGGVSQLVSHQKLLLLVLIYYWRCGEEAVAQRRCAYECECLCSDRTDVLHDVSLVYVALCVCCCCCCCSRVGVNRVCLLADDCGGDHRERQGRCEKVWDLVQWQGGSVCGSGKESSIPHLTYLTLWQKHVIERNLQYRQCYSSLTALFRKFLLVLRLLQWRWRWLGLMSFAESWLTSRSCFEVCGNIICYMSYDIFTC